MSDILTVKDLILKDANSKFPPIVEFQNYEHKVVGAMYLSKVDPDDLVLTETTNDEKYYLYYHGIGLFFTYWRKINK